MAEPAFVDVDTDLDTTLPLDIESLGKLGLLAYFPMDSLSFADGAPMSGTIPSLLGLGALTVVGAPVMHRTASEVWASTDGIDDYFSLPSFTALGGIVRTVSLVVRVDDAAGAQAEILDGGGVNIVRNTGNVASMFGGSTLGIPLPSATWSILTISVNAASSFIGRNALAPVGGNVGAGVLGKLDIGKAGAGYGAISVASIGLWASAAADAAEVLAIGNQGIANHPTLF